MNNNRVELSNAMSVIINLLWQEIYEYFNVVSNQTFFSFLIWCITQKEKKRRIQWQMICKFFPGCLASLLYETECKKGVKWKII